MKAAIKVSDVSKSFGSSKALSNVSFTVQKGDIFGFLGPNGAGKTTLIRCLMDYIRADSGSIQVFRQDSRADSVRLKSKIGYVPADHNLYEHWTGHEHIAFVEEVRGSSARVDSLIERLNFKVSVKVKHLSSGNKQKLALILALLGEPELLVLDEPTQGLDPIFQNEIYEILRDFQGSGGTVFLSSHNLPEVERICNRVAVINQGQLSTEQTLDDLRQVSTHKVVVHFAKNVARNAFNIDGVSLVNYEPRRVELKVQGPLDGVVKALANFTVTDLEVTHASLEEVFMGMYSS